MSSAKQQACCKTMLAEKAGAAAHRDFNWARWSSSVYLVSKLMLSSLGVSAPIFWHTLAGRQVEDGASTLHCDRLVELRLRCRKLTVATAYALQNCRDHSHGAHMPAGVEDEDAIEDQDLPEGRPAEAEVRSLYPKAHTYR